MLLFDFVVGNFSDDMTLMRFETQTPAILLFAASCLTRIYSSRFAKIFRAISFHSSRVPIKSFIAKIEITVFRFFF